MNSTLCPLCKDGIGHAMDDRHAELVGDLVSASQALIDALDADDPRPIDTLAAKACLAGVLHRLSVTGMVSGAKHDSEAQK